MSFVPTFKWVPTVAPRALALWFSSQLTTLAMLFNNSTATIGKVAKSKSAKTAMLVVVASVAVVVLVEALLVVVGLADVVASVVAVLVVDSVVEALADVEASVEASVDAVVALEEEEALVVVVDLAEVKMEGMVATVTVAASMPMLLLQLPTLSLTTRLVVVRDLS